MFDAGRRPTGRHFYWLLMVAMIAGSGWMVNAAAAGPQSGPATTTVADTVYLADGTAASGTLIVTWPAFTTASGTAVAGGVTNVTLAANGALSVALVPNAGATPAGVYYTVIYQIGPGEVKTEYWVVPTTSPANLAGVRTTPGSGGAAQPVSMQYVNTQLAGVVHLTGTETITGAKVFSVPPNVPTPVNAGDVASKGYVDQSVSNVGSGSYLSTAGGTMTGPITLPANPAAPLQAATKQYVDLGLTSKASLVAGLVPASQLGTGTASGSNCLLGNDTWGPCGGAGNVSTSPSAGTSQNITQPVGTQFSTNNLAGISFVVSSYNWSQSPTDSLVTAGSNTIHLTPCPAGVDTSNNSSAQYAVYIAGTGTAEAAPVTGGTCSSGASTGTIIVTTAHTHSAGYTVGAANGGNQEAINVAAATGGTHVVIQEVPTGGADAANYNIYWPVFLKASKSILNGYGAEWACYTRSTCLMVGTYAGGANSTTVEGLELQSAVNVTGAHIASVSAAAGTYTVTTSTAHNLVAGDWAILYYTTPAQQQEARVQVLSTGLTATQFKYVVGGATFSASAGFGWVAIENAAIEAETDGTRLQDIKFNTGLNGGMFHQGVVVGNDQSFKIDGMTNEGSGGAFRCDQYFCSNMVYLRGDQGAAPVAYLHHLEASMQCSGNGVRDVAGNTLNLQDSVIQGVNQYAVYYTGGLQPWVVNNVYNETGSCYNPFYPGSQAAIAGYIDNGQPLTVLGNAPIGGVFPQFDSGGANQRNYYVITKDANLGTAPMMFIGTALPATGSTSIPLYWPNPDLVGAGTRSFDILVTTGVTQTSAPYTGNAFSIATGVSGNCNSSGICSYTDTQSAATAYAVATASWAPTLPFWPGAIILGSGASLYSDQCGQASAIISTSYLPRVFCKQGLMAGTAYSYSPYWGIFQAGDSEGNGNKNVGAQVMQIGPASGSWTPGISGALNFNPGPGTSVSPRQIITTMDGNPQQTFATPGYVRSGSAADSFIGTDSMSSVGAQDQTYGAPGGHYFYVNDAGTSGTSWLEGLSATLKTFKVPVQFNTGVTFAGVTFGGITGAVQCLHASATGVVTGTGSDCGSGGGGGSGTVNSGAASQVAMYSGSGAAVSGDGVLTDSGTVLSYAGSGGIAATSGAFSGNLTVGGQLILTGPWVVDSPIPGSAMGAAAAGTSSIGISSDGNFYISANGGAPQEIATGSGGGGAVTSVFGRAGVVAATSGDYSVAQVTGAAPLASPTFTGVVTEPVPTLPSQAANYFFASPNGSAGVPSFRAIVAADVPTLNQNTTGTAAGLSGTPALPNGTTGTTQSAGDSSTKLATTAFATANFAGMSVSSAVGDIPKISGNSPTPAITDSGVLSGPYPIPWLTVYRGSGSATFSQNVVKMWGVVLTFPLSTYSVAYDVLTADNTGNTYDIGIANTSGAIVLNLGATAGTTFAPTAGAKTANWSQGTKILQPGKYYVVITTNCASSCAAIYGNGDGFAATFQNGTTAGTTSGGALAAFTPPSDVWSWGGTIPALAVK